MRLQSDGEENNLIEIDAGPDVVSNQNQLKNDRLPEILKLNIDCFEETLDYSPREEMIAIGQTCQILNQVAGYIFRRTYFGAEIRFIAGKGICVGENELKSNHFNGFIHKVRVLNSDGLQHMIKVQPIFPKLKRIEFFGTDLTAPNPAYFNEILAQVESLEISNCKLDGNFYESILALCGNLKHLKLIQTQDFSNMIGNSNDWLVKKYPSLKALELKTKCTLHDGELVQFLELNQNVRVLSIAGHLLKMNEQALMRSTVKLDDLPVLISSDCPFDAQFNDLLKRLHEHGLYQRLQISSSFTSLNQNDVDRLVTFNGLLVKLSVYWFHNPVQLSGLVNLKELNIGWENKITDFMELPTNLVNLERIEIANAHFHDIFGFVARAKKLKQIKIDHLENGSQFNSKDNFINLVALNSERAKLQGARTVRIYVTEEIYLATKWRLKETNFNLVRLKRIESVEWDQEFGFYLG